MGNSSTRQTNAGGGGTQAGRLATNINIREEKREPEKAREREREREREGVREREREREGARESIVNR